MGDLSFATDGPAYSIELLGCLVAQVNDLVEGVGDLSGFARPFTRQANRKISLFESYENFQE
jgi:hypothetical protein